jgi:hypothetical protein
MHTVISDYGRGTKEVTDVEYEARALQYDKGPIRAMQHWGRLAMRHNTTRYDLRQAITIKQVYPEASHLRSDIANRPAECELRACRSLHT